MTRTGASSGSLTERITSAPLKPPNPGHYRDCFHRATFLSASLLCGLRIQTCIHWNKAAPGHNLSLSLSLSYFSIFSSFASSFHLQLENYAVSLLILLVPTLTRLLSKRSIYDPFRMTHTTRNNEVFFSACHMDSTGATHTLATLWSRNRRRFSPAGTRRQSIER